MSSVKEVCEAFGHLMKAIHDALPKALWLVVYDDSFSNPMAMKLIYLWWVYSFTMNTIKSSQKEARNTPLENEQEILLCSIYCNNSNVLAIAINLLYYFIDAFPHKSCIPRAQTNKQCHRHKRRRQ